MLTQTFQELTEDVEELSYLIMQIFNLSKEDTEATVLIYHQIANCYYRKNNNSTF